MRWMIEVDGVVVRDSETGNPFTYASRAEAQAEADRWSQRDGKDYEVVEAKGPWQ